MTGDPRPLTDQLASAVDSHIREHLWNGPAIALGDDRFEPLDEDETTAAGGGEFDVVLRGPGGALFDVHTHVAITPRSTTAVVDRLPEGAEIVGRSPAKATWEE